MERYSYSYKEKADELRKIEMSWLKKYGYVYNNNSYEYGGITWTNSQTEKKNSISYQVTSDEQGKQIRIFYTITDRNNGVKREIDYSVPIVSTPCNFGGLRYWFRCSLSKQGVYCGRRVGKLYLGGDYFACRHCYDLTYDSKFINKKSKFYSVIAVLDLWDKVEKIEKTMKVRFYNGKPTRKMEKIMNLKLKAMPYIYTLK